jgi:hypothetical protein
VSDESLFREVDEEVRQEQIKKLWDKYGNYFTALCVVIVLVVAGFKGWQYWQLTQSQEAARSYDAAVKLLADGKNAEADAAFAAINHAGYGKIATLRRAESLIAQGKDDEAVAVYDALAVDNNADQAVRDLARMRAAYALVDKLAPAELLSRIGSFDNDQSPWRGAAREVFALSAYRTGDLAMADRYLNAIVADNATPHGLRQRARTMLQVIAPLLGTKS